MSFFKERIRTVTRPSLVALTVMLTGCLPVEDQGTVVVGQETTTPPDFSSQPAPGTNPTQPSPDTAPQTPPPVVTPTPGAPVYPIRPNPSADLVVNGGALRTKDEMLTLQFLVPEFFYFRMKVGYTADCTDGVWEELSESQTRPMPRLNSVNTVSVQYLDYDFGSSQCVAKSIVHDNQGPEILFTSYPMASLEQGSEARISYSVTDLSPIATTVCRLNDLERPCGAGVNEVNITALPQGNYIFEVEASDDLGNTSKRQVSWTVVASTRLLSQNIRVNNYNKVDILTVIDNSGSMAYEQRNMAARVGNFLNILQGLDWRIAVTTTDPTATTSVNTMDPALSSGLRAPAGAKNPYRFVSDGLFLPIHGLPGQFYLDSTMAQTEAQSRLGLTLQRPETGSGSEQAIYATYRTLERAFQAPEANPVQRGFFRDGAQFAVVVISDEDESANGPKNDPQNLLKLIQTTFEGQRAFSWHSIITRPGDTACRNTQGAAYGERYNLMSTLTGGLIGSVCEADYALQLMGIASKIRQLVKTITLSCQPLGQFPIAVTKDGQPYAGAFTVEGVNLNFTAELPPGDYNVMYRCLK